MPTTLPLPFKSNADFVEQELLWVRARCRYLGVLREIEADADTRVARRPVTVVGDEELTGTSEQRRRAASLKAIEEGLRRELDSRMAITRQAGIALGLDRVCDAHGLDAVERSALLLALAPCIGTYWLDEMAAIGPHGFGLGSATVEIIAAFNEATFEQRLGFARYINGSSSLVKAGLVVVEPGRTAYPADWPQATVTLTSKGFAAITGVEVADKATCPACAQAVAS
ncbi:MAG: hypothetical protein AMXMBFR58_36560 [Phycisphaerae bacterium]